MTETAATFPLVGTTLGDTYRITRQMAIGGMGELYEATHMRLSGRYAVKVLLPQVASHQEVIARFQREAEITSSLRHPNIVSVIDFNTTPDGRPFLAMEYLEGRDLAADIGQQGPMTLERTLDLTDQVVSALAAAHAHGVVHRDLKPQNLFISALPGDGREIVKVLDFGISKMREAHTRLTREHSIMGTPQYMAPEQALGNAQAIDHRTDQFSLASIVYEMLTGQPPFTADSVSAVLYQVVHEEPPPLSRFRRDLPAGLDRVLARAMSKDSDARYPNIGDFGRALVSAGRQSASNSREALAMAATMRRTTATGHRSRPVTTRGQHWDTTFGASTAQVSNDELRATVMRRQRGWGPPVAGLLAAAVAVAGATWFSMRPNEEPPARAAAPAPASAPAAAGAGARVPAPASTPTPVPAASATETRRPVPAPPQTAPAAELGSPAGTDLDPAPLRVFNAPAGLRVMVDDGQVELPAKLPRRPGRYRLRFESPGRQTQVMEVDALAPSHDLRLYMPRLAAREDEPAEPESADPQPTAGAAAVAAPPPAPIPTPIPTPEPPVAAPAKARPTLIQDVDDAPAPPAENPKVPLIEDP